jgi:hypothetical protein
MTCPITLSGFLAISCPFSARSCTRVLANSKGYVVAASTPPATPPATKETSGSAFLEFFGGLMAELDGLSVLSPFYVPVNAINLSFITCEKCILETIGKDDTNDTMVKSTDN